MRMYDADMIKKKWKSIDRAVGGAIFVWLIGLAIYGKGFDVIFSNGVVAIMIAMVVGILSNIYIDKTYSRCVGEVVEVRRGQVTGYFKNPFVYRTKDLLEENTQLVSIPDRPYSASETRKVAVNGNVVTCTLRCTAAVVDFQSFYDAFLRPDFTVSKLVGPEGVMEERIITFLAQESMWIVELYQEENISDDKRSEYAEEAIKRKATKCLQEKLNPHGLGQCEVSVICGARAYEIV